MGNTVIIDYGAGNLFSLASACRRLGLVTSVSSDAGIIKKAERVIFPGVGHASMARENIDRYGLAEIITSLTQPVLGICLGMQMMLSHSEEGDTRGLAIFDPVARKFKAEGDPGIKIKVPHTGWNRVHNLKGELFEGVDESSFLYFVHGYYAELSDYTTATTTYGIKFSAALQKDNFFGCQFHPEKSGETGMIILKNFIQL